MLRSKSFIFLVVLILPLFMLFHNLIFKPFVSLSFAVLQERVGNASKLQDPITDLENIPPDDSVKGSMKWNDKKLTEPQVDVERLDSGSKMMLSTGLSHCLLHKAYSSYDYMTARSQSNQGIQESLLVNDECVDSLKEAGVDCHSGEDLR